MSTSLRKAMHLLKTLARHGEGLGVRALAREAGLTAATAHALLKTLQEEDFVAWDPTTKGYRLGLGLGDLAAAVDAQACFGLQVEPTVEALFTEVGESVTAAAWLAGRVRVVAKHQSLHQLVTALPDGEVRDPHRWASGLVLLAAQDDRVVAAYALAHGLDDLAERLAQVRRRGHAEAIDVDGSGVAALAVPVANADGVVRLALAVSAPMARFGVARRKEVLALLKRSATHLSRGIPS